MNLIELRVDKVVPYFNNPRINSDAIQIVVQSIEEFGFQVPIIVDESNVIIAGHTRWEAAKRLGMTTVPVVVASNLSPTKAQAFRIMDNKAAEFSRWDLDKLVTEFETLEFLECDMTTLGFELLEIEKLKLDFEGTDVQDESYVDAESKDFDGTLNKDTGSTTGNSDDVPPTSSKPVIQYSIIFNNEDEQTLWYEYLRGLKVKYPELETISERLIEDIKSNGTP